MPARVAKKQSTPRWTGGRRLSVAQVRQLWRRYQRLSCWRRKAAIRDAELEVHLRDEVETSGVVWTHERSRKIRVVLRVGCDEADVRATILHEMAHIDVPKVVHAKSWQQRFVEAAEEAHGPVLGEYTLADLDAELVHVMVGARIKEQLKKRQRARLARQARQAQKKGGEAGA